MLHFVVRRLLTAFVFCVSLFVAGRGISQAQGLQGGDSLSIPFFPLRAGDVLWYRTDESSNNQYPPSWDSFGLGGTPNSDTTIGLRAYVRIPALGTFRTNGVDSVWARSRTRDYPSRDTELLWMTFSNLRSGDTLGLGYWQPDQTVVMRGMDTSASPFGTGMTRKVTVSVITHAVDAGTSDYTFDERFGLLSQTASSYWSNSTMSLTGGIFEGVMYGESSGVHPIPAIAASPGLGVSPTPAVDRAVVSIQNARIGGLAHLQIIDGSDEWR